jgi:glycosyltransferase involved in cell wall biosynthesis
LRCLESVYRQNYQRDRIVHLFIDDASDDGTNEKIMLWLEQHPGHSVKYIHNASRLGGTHNTLVGMQLAPDDAVVIELNGDDWLPDGKVLAFYNGIYADPNIWMTYNSMRVKNGPPAARARRIPKRVVEGNTFRDEDDWRCSHLHTFRKKLFNHVPEDVFYDPISGEFWECADDQALFFSMLELAGKHSRHINRITCVYNFWESSHSYKESKISIETAMRIRRLKKFKPLDHINE